MKFKTTKKAIRENYFSILSIGYCAAQNLLYYENPIAYSAGVYGWACDYYYIDNVLISTGYSPIQSKGTNASYELITELDKKASGKTKEERRELLSELIAKSL